MTTKARPKVPTVPRHMADDPNLHIVGCLDPNAGKDVRMVIFARVPHDAVSVYFLCRNCRRRHNWVLDKRVREWKDRG